MNSTVIETLLSVQNLHAGYGSIPILHGMTLNVYQGEIVGVLGHNGMGKTTLLKQLMGFIPATSGSVIFDGIDITRDATHQRSLSGLGYVPQGRGIFSQLTVKDNLRFALSGDSDPSEEEQSLEKALHYFPQLKRLLDRKGGNLSGGEQQLLALARCLIVDPMLVLLDEPTEGIQPSIIEEIANTLKLIRDKEGLTILVVEQNLDFLKSVSDRLLIIERGLVIGEVQHDEVDNSPLMAEFVGLGGNTKAAAPQQPSVINPL